MRQLKSIAFTGMLALLMTGCASGDEQAAVSPSVSPTPAASPSPAATAPPKAQPFGAQKPPVVAATAPRTAAPALIQPTNADARAQQVSQGRQDPFALLPLPPVPVPPPPGSQPPAPVTVPQVRSVPNTTRTSTTTTRTSGANAGAGATGRRPTTGQPGAVAGRPNTTAGRPNASGTRPGTTAQPGIPTLRPGTLVQPTAPTIAALPQLPQPTLAQSVEVSGVIQVGAETRAIVKAPNEATSRYVTVGQRLSNGQILVKRIEMNTGSEPVVVLEQYGIEVARRVGDKPAQPAGGNPTA